MAEMLTAKEMQDLLQVDRSTIYRMAEAGRLPAIKIGKQWRFPADQVESWLGTHSTTQSSANTPPATPQIDATNEAAPNALAAMIPVECVQLIQDSYADLLGVMIVITDMQGKPITEISNPCGLFSVIKDMPDAVQKCIQSWHKLAVAINLEPQFSLSHLGLLCARGMIRVGTELKGMVVAGCVAPPNWPPSEAELQQIADSFGVPAEMLAAALNEVYVLDADKKTQVLAFVQRIANIVAHIVGERNALTGKLRAIEQLAHI